MSAADSDFLALQSAVAGRFSLDREIGRGGMGIVFLARDVLLERQVAIKLLAPALGARRDMRRRFLREARIAAQCFHPHIVPIHAVEESNDLAWIVMPYVRGETLAERVRRLGPLPADEVRRLARDVGWALAYAHQRGVVHRDIKPENILIESSSGRFLIADFGIARGGDESSVSSSSGAGAGTPRYMAPEQALGELVDGRADLYALGATLFVAATGRPPFDANNSVALMAQHATLLAPSVRQFAPALPLPLADAIDRCLAKRPDDRYPNAEQFVDALAAPDTDIVTAPALRPLGNNAQGARTLVGWGAASALTTLLLVLGEPSNSFGYGIIVAVGGWFSAFITLGGVVRGGEAMLHARRALREGHDREDIARALAGEVSPTPLAPTSRRKHLVTALLGAGMALAQAKIDDLHFIPAVLQSAVQATFIFAPVLLIARGVTGVLSGSSLAHRLHDRVARPFSRFLTRIAGRGIAQPARPASLVESAPTEVLLDRAVRDAIALLPPTLRDSFGNAAELASSLAREAEALRRQDALLQDEERVARHAGDDANRESQLAQLAGAREAVRARLGTTIAALEAVRLDILRLDVGQPPAPGLTTQLEAVRELGRRVDADIEVNALLDRRSLSRSNP